MNLFLQRFSATTFGYVRRDRNYGSTYLIAESILLKLGETVEKMIHIHHQFLGFLPNIKFLKRINYSRHSC